MTIHEVPTDPNSQKWYIGDKGASNNNVIIDTPPTSRLYAAGGYSGLGIQQGNIAANNTLIISDNDINNTYLVYAYGGYVKVDNVAASVTKNTLIIESGSRANGAFGGYASVVSGSATVENNALSISGSVGGLGAYGGFASVTNAGTSSATVKDNTLTIESGGSVGGGAYGGYVDFSRGTVPTATATAENNTLTIKSGSRVKNDVYGGYVTHTQTGSAVARNNTLTIESGGLVEGDAFGGLASAQGDGFTSATGNTVILNGGSWGAHKRVVGGQASSYGTATDERAVARGNTVFLNGGSFGTDSHVYGGRVVVENSTGRVTDNTVVLGAGLGANDLAGVELYGGGFDKYGTGTVDVSDNTLKVEASGVTVQSINNFENYRFAANALSTTTTALTLDKQPAALTIAADKVSFDAGKGELSISTF